VAKILPGPRRSTLSAADEDVPRRRGSPGRRRRGTILPETSTQLRGTFPRKRRLPSGVPVGHSPGPRHEPLFGARTAKLWQVKLAAPPERWLVTLADGSAVEVWADSVEGLSGPEDQRDYLFGNFMDIDPADQYAFDVTATTPGNPGRVVVTVARFPRPSVIRVITAP
jgi:hypothetical protein